MSTCVCIKMRGLNLFQSQYTHGKEGWIFIKKYEERRLGAAEMWCYQGMLRISCMEKTANKSVLDELQTRCELFAQIIKRKMTFFGHARINNTCNIVNASILGKCWGKEEGSLRKAVH